MIHVFVLMLPHFLRTAPKGAFVLPVVVWDVWRKRVVNTEGDLSAVGLFPTGNSMADELAVLAQDTYSHHTRLLSKENPYKYSYKSTVLTSGFSPLALPSLSLFQNVV